MPTEERLSLVLSEFARTLSTDFPIQGILDHLVGRIVDVLPIDAAGVTLISPTTQPRFIAASDTAARGFEQLQTDLGEGPCLAAYDTDSPIAIPDLAEDDRFPLFAERAQADGLVAVFTFPLRDSGRGLGALDLYRATSGALSDSEMDAAQTLADVATAYLLNAQARSDLKAASTTEHETLEKLRELDQAKTEFVATVIHELRSPLTSISGSTEILQGLSTGALTADQHKLVDLISRNSERLTALADDLLTLASLEPGALIAEWEDIDVRQSVEQAQVALLAQTDTRRLDVTFEVPAVPVVVQGDARYLERLVSNLLTNAVKFTNDGGTVRCTLTRTRRCARLTVSDNGIGIPQEEQQMLFTRFFRSSTAQAHHIQGSGLGLTIVESIVRGHGGTIAVDSAHMCGTTFTVDLPLKSDDHLEDERRRDLPRSGAAP